MAVMSTMATTMMMSSMHVVTYQSSRVGLGFLGIVSRMTYWKPIVASIMPVGAAMRASVWSGSRPKDAMDISTMMNSGKTILRSSYLYLRSIRR